ncbi:outer membrane beta-barrel protein [Salegentibacter flavus]|uniref:CarboxypepD_reg-like domain-containing protein n=1 Tax=Salegentibacter flavus TaxID=287099 RepID=A0A1I5B5Q3_9FLAO|nr:outer membrane beta-barrel protein [Salegentibacter flavus]SFN69940.1 CarboxypepD_reg-like domain-containing protein [Salegentibacter flavus]
MRIFLFLAFFCFAGTLAAQNFEISGKVVAPDGSPLESATIYTEKPSDSSLVTYTISERDGSFLLKGNTSAENLNFLISFAGFRPYKQNIKLKENTNLGTIEMEIQDALDEILVTGTRAPISVKRDTLEFNAASFATRPDANLEELLKNIPGVEVDTEGNITVNGKPVQRILVNGKEFFGDDPKIATKNLPKEIIDKIQVTDTKTKSEEFTGKAGDSENQTINIKLQEDKNKGYFARATAGGGTDDRYELSGIGNYFKDDMRISALASSNNINSSGFSFDEVFDMMGRNARMMSFNRGGGFSINGNSFGSSGGITKSETAGFNFVNEWNDKLELSTDYFFGRNDTETMTITERENILPDSRYYSNSENTGNLVNDSHRANARFEIEFDTLTRLSIRPRLNANRGFSARTNTSESLNEDRELINNTQTSNNEEIESNYFSNNIDFIRRFGSRGAYLQVDLSQSHNDQKNENVYYSETNIFRGDQAGETQIQDQYIDEEQKENSFSAGISQRSVLTDNLFLDLSYDFSTAKSTNVRNVFDAENNAYTNINEQLSNDFEVNSQKNIPNLGLNYEGESLRWSTEAGLLNTRLKTNNFRDDVSFDNTFNNLYLRANVRYEISKSQNIYFNYRTDANVPSIRQLQPVADRTNPLNILVGNPSLDPAFSQDFRLYYRNFDFATRSGFFGHFSASFTDNNVVAYTTTDDDLVRTTTYTNVDGAMNANAGMNYSKTFKKEARTLGYRFGLNGSYSKNVGFTNAVKFNSKNYGIRPSVRLTYTIEDLVDINPSYNLSYNESKYDINPARNENFMNHTVSLDATTYWPENIVLGNDISYNYFGNVAPGFDNSALLWNISLGYQFLDDDATIKVKVYDMLNQNVDTRRMIGDDFIQDTSNLILRRYAMLSFTYKISKFGGKDPNRNRRRF